MEEKKTFKEKMEQFKNDLSIKTQRVKAWFAEHPEEGKIVIGGVLATIPVIITGVAKASASHQEKELKDRYIYDRSLGHYYHLRRKVKQNEWLEIERRKMTGEPIGYILEDMRLI